MIFRSIRLRLALWHLGILATLQVVFCFAVYQVLSTRMLSEVDSEVRTVVAATAVNLLRQSTQDDAKTRAARALDQLIHAETPVVILDANGSVLAERPLGAARITPLPVRPIVLTGFDFTTLKPNAAKRIGVRRVGVERSAIEGETYYIAASQSLDSYLGQLHIARLSFFITLPLLLFLTAWGGWVLTGKSLAPAAAMSERARLIDAADFTQRIQPSNPHDELGTLACSLNELLDRIASCSVRERQFMADAAHELRTPAAVILATSELLTRRERTNEEYAEGLSTIAHYSSTMVRSIDDVFRLAQADAGFRSPQMHPLYLDEVLTQACRAAKVLAASKSIDIKMGPLPEMPACGEESLLGELFLNLLENAIKYTPAHGVIALEATITAESYQVRVCDSGIGISTEDRSMIFNRFFRARSAATSANLPRPAGSGLGLAIALWIVQSHGGSLELLETGETGSIFAATLPVPLTSAPLAQLVESRSSQG